VETEGLRWRPVELQECLSRNGPAAGDSADKVSALPEGEHSSQNKGEKDAGGDGSNALSHNQRS
jgi:hypothetical protein